MTDLLPAISRAINLATRLRALSDKKVKDAEFKGILDDILLELAEVQLRVEEVLNENATLKGQVRSPKRGLGPRCAELGWRVTGSRPHGQHGAIAQTYKCPKCGLKEEVVVPAK